ncbi:MAG TPA: hypothetical protein VFS66_15485 [Acidimicrobiia bacterium]|nr:hypothetical protein [Acidimicrobiia bacterium]
MEVSAIERILDDANRAVDDGSGLDGTDFWKAVGAVKKDPGLVDSYAERIAEIDRKAFDNWGPMITVPFGLGTTLAALVTVVGFALVGLAYYLDGFAAIVAFGLGVVVLLGSTHTLAHMVVGTIFGIRFTRWFVAEILKPQPGIKIDYASYLRTPPRRRAWMHASGALATKAIPFLMIPAAVAADLPAWVSWLLLVAGLAMIATDVLWSTKSADWKRFAREMKYAQAS